MGKATATAFLVAGMFAVTAAHAAHADEAFVSDYTSTDTRKCRKFERVQVADTEYAAGWACKGLAGYLLVVAEEDLRTTVSVGRTVKAAVAEPAAGQSFGPFNFAYETVEWRSLKGAAKPFAIIQRWNISDNENPDKGGRPGRTALLIVTRLPPGPVCHVAYIDVKANGEANVLARRAADEVARSFDCAKDDVRIIGARGRAIELSGRGKANSE